MSGPYGKLLTLPFLLLLAGPYPNVPDTAPEASSGSRQL